MSCSNSKAKPNGKRSFTVFGNLRGKDETFEVELPADDPLDLSDPDQLLEFLERSFSLRDLEEDTEQ